MTDETSYDSLLSEQFKREQENSTDGAEAISVIDNENAVAEEEATRDRFQKSFDGSGLTNDGPPAETYDYPAAHKNGASFTRGSGGGEEEGGVELPLENFRPGQLNVGGFTTPGGFRVKDTFKDQEGHISGAMQELEKTSMNTNGKVSIRDIKPLTKAAFGMVNEGATYEDFKSHIKGPWKEGQLVQAWVAAHKAWDRGWLEKQATENNIINPGPPNWSATPDQGGLKLGEPVLYENLRNDPVWLEAAAKVYEWEHGYAPEDRGIEPYQVSQSAMHLMARYSAHLWAQGGITARIMNEEDSDTLQALGVLFRGWQDLSMGDPAMFARYAAHFAADFSIGKMHKYGMKFVDMGRDALHNVTMQKLAAPAAGAIGGGIWGAIGAGLQEGVDMTIENDLQARAVSGEHGGEGMSFGEGERDIDPETIGMGAVFGSTLGVALPAGMALYKAVKAGNLQQILEATGSALKPTAVSTSASAVAAAGVKGYLPETDMSDPMKEPEAMP